MFVTIDLLWTAYVLSWPVLVLLFLAGVLFEHTQSHGWAVFMGILGAVVSYFYFDVAITVILEWAVAYLVIGVVWSFWRYHVHVSDAVKKVKESGVVLSEGRRVDFLQGLSPSQNLNLITAWIIIWPFSAVENILGDIITAIQSLVTKVFRSVYAKIYASQIASLDEVTKKV